MSVADDVKNAAKQDAAYWEDFEDTAGVALSILVMVGAVTGPLALPAACAGVMLAVAKLKKNAARRLAADPPDPDYRSPVELEIPAVVTVIETVPRDRPSPLDGAAAHLGREAAWLDALTTAYERLEAAADADDAEAADDRAHEVRSLGTSAVSQLRQQAASLEPLLRALRDTPSRQSAVAHERSLLSATLVERSASPLGFLLRRMPDGLLAGLMRSGVAPLDLDFDPRIVSEDDATLEAVLRAPGHALAARLELATRSATQLAESLTGWLDTADLAGPGSRRS
jgi:hypothetical protein